MSVALDHHEVSLVSDLLERSERRRIAALSALPSHQQNDLGQFFTPIQAARLIADQFDLPEAGRVRVLDPGAGSGTLTAALAARIFTERPRLGVEIVAVEVDPSACLHLRNTLTDIRETGRSIGRSINFELVEQDFIHACAGIADRHTALDKPFDLVIMNPPYRKLASSSLHRRMLLGQGVDCPNIYAGFIALSVILLAKLGQIVAITPRSFTNGPYFSQFRNFLLDQVALDRIHTFESRSTVFADTGVLQENIIVSATKGRAASLVTLSTSFGHVDEVATRVVQAAEVVRPNDRHRFIRIPSSMDDTAVAELMASMPSQLTDLDLSVSTGRVVDFRAKDRLLDNQVASSVPLVYPGNLRGGIVEWPRQIRKPQAFKVESRSADMRRYLMPAGFYVVVKRFTSKEERRRVVAAVWNPDAVPSDVAFENHVNVFHSHSHGLDRGVAVGLSYWLNSSIVDAYFRTFSGHTQVNATDLRSLRYPSLAALHAIGEERGPKLPDQHEIDGVVEAMIASRYTDVSA